MATKDEYKRMMPGRIIGVSKDARGQRALRMALQTREQHIRREKATSNICTAQALLANTSAMYGVYHGPKGLRNIAENVHAKAQTVALAAKELGFTVPHQYFFDTVRIDSKAGDAAKIQSAAEKRGINVRVFSDKSITVSIDETTTRKDVEKLLEVLSEVSGRKLTTPLDTLSATAAAKPAIGFPRTSEYLTHPVFNSYHSEHEMLRYMYRLQLKDIGLTTSMIPLGYVSSPPSLCFIKLKN